MAQHPSPPKIRKLDDNQRTIESMDIDGTSSEATHDILNDRNLNIDRHFVLKHDKLENSKMRNAKIFEFTKGLESFDFGHYIDNLKLEFFPNLFIFVMKSEKFNFSDNNLIEERQHSKVINKVIEKFQNARPLLWQLKSTIENTTKFFYKQENLTSFVEIDMKPNDPLNFDDFASFFSSYINGALTNIDFEKLLKMNESFLIIKFLRCCDISETTWRYFILKCASHGTKEQLLAALDSSFESKGRLLNLDEQLILEIMSVAIEYNNKAIIEYLIRQGTHLVQQISLMQQIVISTTLYTTKKIDILCELLDFADFPFPENFNLDSINDQRLINIIEDRKNFNKVLDSTDMNAVDEKIIKCFIKNNPNLKICYNIQNKSALFQVILNNKMKSYNFLRQHGFLLAKNETASLTKGQQTEINVMQSVPNDEKVIILLTAKSYIYNKDLSPEQEKEYRSKIYNWFRDIYATKVLSLKHQNKILNIGSELLKIASQCENLKIIFDFENELVNDMDLICTTDAFGTVHLNMKWIFIGAKITTTGNRDNIIKGIIAHEICHYVINFLFENNAKPYLLTSKKNHDDFEVIVNQYNNVDDKCEGIISNVYNGYSNNLYHQELIVRVPQILVYFNGNDRILTEIIGLYRKLFEYFETIVLPELEKFDMKNRDLVRKFNKYVGLLPDIINSNIELKQGKLDPTIGVSDHQFIAKTTNSSSLLIHNICYNLNQKYGNLFDTVSVFIRPEVLNTQMIEDFELILSNISDIKIIINCSNIPIEMMQMISKNSTAKIIFVGPINSELERNQHFHAPSIHFCFSDLTLLSQRALIQAPTIFQNNSTSSLVSLVSNMSCEPPLSISNQPASIDVLSNVCNSKTLIGKFEFPLKSQLKINTESKSLNRENETFEIETQLASKTSMEQQNILKDLESIVNDELLNKLIEWQYKKSVKIQINQNFCIEKSSQMISRDRCFVKKYTEPRSRTMHIDEFKIYSYKIKWQDKIKINSLPKRIDKDNIEFKETEMKESKITEDQLLLDVEKHKYVLISDVAGSGKSWMIKRISNLLNTKYPRKWISYVDLKKFIKEFIVHKSDFNFAKFLTQNILKSKHEFELKIFIKLYMQGRVLVLFDGFDEISPDCAKVVLELIKSFELNQGNQLWISSRDYFEINLKKELNLQVVYKLDEFTVEDGRELITSNWILDGINENKSDKVRINTESDFEKLIKNSPNYNEYDEHASNLIKKIPNADSQSIGHPQVYNMLADIFKGNKNNYHEITVYKIYNEFADIKYKIWSQDKGELRTKGATQVQNKRMNFMELHHYMSITTLFPREKDITYLVFDEHDWPVEEIITCGMLNGDENKLSFLHETFREYFAANFIIKMIRYGDWKKYEQFFAFFIKFLTKNEYKVIRLFIDDALADHVIFQKSQEIIEDMQLKIKEENFEKSIKLIFSEGLEQLTNFLIEIFKKMDNERTKKILNDHIKYIISETSNSKVFLNLLEFIFNAMNVDDIKEMFSNCNIFHSLLHSRLNSDVVEKVADQIERIEIADGKTCSDFIKNSLDDELINNLIYTQFFDDEKFKMFMKIIQKHLNHEGVERFVHRKFYNSEISINVIQECLNFGDGYLLKSVWTEIKNYYMAQNSVEEFHNLLHEESINFRNRISLHIAAFSKGQDFHKTLWELLLSTFDDREKLTELILKQDLDDNNFIHILVSFREADIIEHTFKTLKDNLSTDQYEKILISRGFRDRNLLQKAADISTNIKSHGALWNIVKEFYGNDEKFFEMIKDECDERGNSVLFVATSFSTLEVFKFMIEYIEELNIVSKNKRVKEILFAKNGFNEFLWEAAEKLNSIRQYNLRSYINSILKKLAQE